MRASSCGHKGSTQYFNLRARIECLDGLSSTDLFHRDADGGDLGSLATRGVDELHRSAVCSRLLDRQNARKSLAVSEPDCFCAQSPISFVGQPRQSAARSSVTVGAVITGPLCLVRRPGIARDGRNLASWQTDQRATQKDIELLLTGRKVRRMCCGDQ